MTDNTLPSPTFTPAAGFRWLTPLYDRFVATLTREQRWRGAFVAQIAPLRDDVIVDLGCGTGTMLVRLAQAAPEACLMGLDPDPEILRLAQRKVVAAKVAPRLIEGFGRDAAGVFGEWGVTKVISSLVLHQVPIAEKRALLTAAHDLLLPGGELHVADYGRQANRTMRLLFRFTVQLVDGVADTEPQAKGMLPELIVEAGFDSVTETHAFDTPTGTIRLYRAMRR